MNAPTTKLNIPKVARPAVITPEEASGRMLVALEAIALSLDIISAYYEKKGISEGIFTKEEFEDEGEKKE